jgi:uncharacterized membrane protein (UPF0127 family)
VRRQNPVRPLIAIAVVFIVAVAIISGIAIFLGTLSSNAEDDGDSIDREPLTVVTAQGQVAHIDVEVADTPEERSVGLSGRTSLPADTGMLFIIPTKGPGFWMKDTLVPLSVAFLGRCGEIVSIQDMQPESLEIHTTDQDYSFGLETPLGWFTEHGIQVGDLVSIPRDYRPDGC